MYLVNTNNKVYLFRRISIFGSIDNGTNTYRLN